jgi:hypothetical protein
MTVTVGTGGTYKAKPTGTSKEDRQFATLRFSAVVLYRCAREYIVSPDDVIMRSHPAGVVHEVGTKSVFVGMRVSVMPTMVGVTVADAVSLTSCDATVYVAVGKSNEMVGGIEVGVA